MSGLLTVNMTNGVITENIIEEVTGKKLCEVVDLK